MRKLNLFKVVQDSVRSSYEVTGDARTVESFMKQKYGIDSSCSDSFNSLEPEDQIYNLITKAIEEGLKFFDLSQLTSGDPVSGYTSALSGKKVSKIHPLDSAFNFIAAAQKQRAGEEKRFSDFVQSGHADEINDILLESSKENNSLKPNHSKGEIYKSINDVFLLNCPSAKGESFNDPVNKIAKSGVFGAVQFPVEPSHSLKEWKNLLENIIGPEEEPAFAGAIDPVNDFVASQLGQQLPSFKNLELIKNKLMTATYQYAYKLTPGSDAYFAKENEITNLKEVKREIEARLQDSSVPE